MVNADTITQKQIWDVLETVCDPEVPVLSIVDLGIVRDVRINESIEIIVTPTYTGCPAIDMISMNIRLAMLQHGHNDVKITQVLSPAWTTAWMTEGGKQKLNAYGIAAPNPRFEIPQDGIECPQCNSTDTKLLSEFGSTACKSLFQCRNCLEPFDYFKCH